MKENITRGSWKHNCPDGSYGPDEDSFVQAAFALQSTLDLQVVLNKQLFFFGNFRISFIAKDLTIMALWPLIMTTSLKKYLAKCQQSTKINFYELFQNSPLSGTKDEFKIEPQYEHKKNLDKPEKKIMSWKWIIIEHWNLIFCFFYAFLIIKLFSSINFDPPYDFSLIFLSFFVCAYCGSILNSSLCIRRNCQYGQK